MPTTAPPTSGAPRRLRLLVGGTVGAALVATATAIWHALHQPALSPAVLMLLLVAVPLSERALLHVRFGGQQYSFTWGEACLLLGFVLATPSWFVLLAGPLVFMVHLSAGRSLLKASFNAACFVVASASAALLLAALDQPPYRLATVREGAALVLAVTLFSVVSAVLTASVVAVSSKTSARSVLADSGRMSLVVWAGNVGGAGAVLALAERGTVLLWALPPLLLAVGGGYRAYLRATTEREAWQQLEASTRELNRLDEHEIALAALTRARLMFRTPDVSLLLDAHGELPVRAYLLDHQGNLVRCSGPVERHGYAATLVTEATHGKVMGVAAPLLGPTGSLGSLELTFGAPVALTRRERQVLSTFSHAVSTTLLNAYLYEDMRAEAARQAHQASHDPLTGLANRSLLATRTASALAASDRVTGLLLLDLDHFKEINDTLGHAAGDVLLQEVAARLRASVGEGALVARLGGDEFAILLTGLDRPEEAEPVAARVLATLAQPVEFEGLHLSVEASLGIACHPMDAGTAEELFRRCDVAMYQAKNERGSWLRYDPLRDDSSVQRLALVGELRAALADQLVVHFQPQVDLATGDVLGAEALVRWQHPVRGLLQPVSFIGVAEQSGLVRPFTLRILELAVEECATWQTPGRELSVAVNLSARSLLDRQLPDDVAAALARHNLPPHCLVLEITENTATSELEVVEEVLGRLRRLGVEISVDDFGTGFSSLAFLQRTAVHELKVDRSFVSGMLVNDNDLALVRATVSLAHSLGARAVAEGVESQALQVALASMGCDVAQGYHLGRPMPAEQLRALLPGAPAPAIPAPRSDGERHLSAVRQA